jgi:hypothetical protein
MHKDLFACRRALLRQACMVGLGFAFARQALSETTPLPNGKLAAGGVRRCVDASGRTSYTNQDCDRTRGTVREREIHVDDARSAADTREAQRLAEREAAFARRARAERLADERRVGNQGPAGIGHRSEVAVSPDQPKRKPTRIKVSKRKRAKAPPVTP